LPSSLLSLTCGTHTSGLYSACHLPLPARRREPRGCLRRSSARARRTRAYARSPSDPGVVLKRPRMAVAAGLAQTTTLLQGPRAARCARGQATERQRNGRMGSNDHGEARTQLWPVRLRATTSDLAATSTRMKANWNLMHAQLSKCKIDFAYFIARSGSISLLRFDLI
jgi:hypothetical protein